MGIPSYSGAPSTIPFDAMNGEFMYNGVHMNKKLQTPEGKIFVMLRKQLPTDPEEDASRIVCLDRMQDFNSRIHRKLTQAELDALRNGTPFPTKNTPVTPPANVAPQRVEEQVVKTSIPTTTIQL